MTTLHASALVILATAVISGCVTNGDDDAERASTSSTAILDATGVADDVRDGIPSIVREDNGVACSSVLLTNVWVLTAAHCVPGAGLALRLELGTERRTAAEIRIHPTLDAALVRVNAPLPVYGRGSGYLRPLYAGPPQALLGRGLRCFGYGARELGGRAADLGTAVLRVVSTVGDTFDLEPNSAGQAIWHGDSGGPCLDDGALTGIAMSLVRAPAAGEIVGAREVGIWGLWTWIAPIYQPTVANPHGRTLLWMDRFGSLETWRMNGGAIAQETRLPAPGGTWQIAGTADFDGDGEGDVLWRTSEGHLAIWFLSFGHIHAVAYPSYRNAPGAVVSPEWKVEGLGDFDANGRADILWRNRRTGQVTAWYMNGGTFLGDAALGTAGLEWQIHGVGDFDGNRRADVLWRLQSGPQAGTVAIWYDGKITYAGYPGAPGLEWQIKGVGDFDGNRRSDILWQSNLRQLAIWYDASTARIGYPGTAGQSWEIAGTGDFDANGRSDIVWQEYGGQAAIWFDANPATIDYARKSYGALKGVLDHPF